MSVLPSRPFRDEHPGRLPAGRYQRGDVRLLELAHELAVVEALRSSLTRRHVHARVRVDQIPPVRRVLDRMLAVPFRQSDEMRAVEIDAVDMLEVWVLTGVPAACREPDLPLLLVDAVDAAHDPLALGDRLRRAVPRIDEVEVPPPVALGGVDHLLGRFEPVDATQVDFLGVSRPDEGVGDFSSMSVRTSPVRASISITRKR